LTKEPQHKIKVKLENEQKGSRSRRPKRWLHRAYCSCGWKSENQRKRKGAAAKEGRAHQRLQGVEA
jgi:hypothetical protein